MTDEERRALDRGYYPEYMSQTLNIPRCCGTCRYRENGTGCCINVESPYKDDYMAPREACGHWKERRKPNA